MRIYSAVLIVLLLFAQSVPHVALTTADSTIHHSPGRATGVDLSVTDISYNYPNTIDQQRYQMFSSNHPIQNFNRPESLFVIDAVIDVPISVEVSISNLGSSNSPAVDLNLLITHNEYQNFAIANITNQISSIRASESITSIFSLTPTYSGNHTISIIPSTSAVDDDPLNDVLTETFTVASHYFNCDDLALWTVGQQWGTNSDVALSMGSACHIGNGQGSNYLPNTVTSLVTPVFDMSDAITNPTRTNGIAYFYTGSIASGDSLKTYSMGPSNNWVELSSITGTVDNDFSDSADWNTWSINHAGAISPLIPSPQQNFHVNSQFRFGFSSDAINNDIGLWIDDIVIVYDQRLRVQEYGITANGVNVEGTVPESWGKATIQLTNTGNISETFTPEISGMPNDWQYYFSQTSGVSITEANGVFLEQGETKIIELNYQPKSAENQGYYPITFTVTSKTHETVSSSIAIQLEVNPDRIPEFLPMLGLTKCAPGSTCVTTVTITNSGGAADVFRLSLDYTNLPLGWSASFSWNQATDIFVQPGFTVPILLTYTVGDDAVPDSVGSFNLIAVSQNDSTRTDSITIEIAASMVSDALVYGDLSNEFNTLYIAPGESETILFNVVNNATVQDIFDTSVVFESANNWVLTDITPAQLYLNAGDSGSFSAKITAPLTAQVGDDCPGYIGSIVSQRSGEVFFTTTIDNLVVSQVNNIMVDWVNQPTALIPGEKNIFTIEVTNLGNGQVPAELYVNGIPATWDITYTSDSEMSGSVIQLGEVSDISASKIVEVAIFVPRGVDHSQVLDLTISALPKMYGDDVDSSDNYITATLVTEVVRNLSLTVEQNLIMAGVGNTTSINISISNLGNIQENDVRFIAAISSEDYLEPLTAYMTLGNTGIPYAFNQYHPLSVDKNSTRTVRIDVVIPDNIDIGSIIIFDFQVISTTNEFDMLTDNTTIEVSYIRQTSVELSANSGPLIDPFGYLWVNITTMSTTEENYRIAFDQPDNWRLICDSVVVSGGNINLSSDLLNIVREDKMFCEVVNEGDILKGFVNVTIYNADNELLHTSDMYYQFADLSADPVNYLSPLTFSILGIVVIIIAGILQFVRRKRNTSDDETGQMSGPPISGPPISRQFTPERTNPQVESVTKSQGTNADNMTPPIPATGLPPGWTMEQWQYYGQQYLDMNNRQ